MIMVKYFKFLLLCLIWGTTFAAIKIGSASTPPMLGLALRYCFALVILFAAILITRRKIPVDRSSLKIYAIVGIYSMGLSYLCTYWGMQYIPSGLSALLWATLPLCTGIFANFMVPSEKLNARHLFSIILAILGVTRIISDWQLVLNMQVLIGCLVVLAGVLLTAYPNVYLKAYDNGYDSMVLTAMAILIGAVIHTTGALLTGQFQRMTWSLVNIGSAAYLGAFGSAVAFIIYYSLLQKIEVVKLSFVTFISPIVAVLVGLIVLKETITLNEVIGVGLIFGGLFLYDYHKYITFFKFGRTA
jgi:drug/metabolite transporter (DMT)-like permease